jgi:hypothetical protein
MGNIFDPYEITSPVGQEAAYVQQAQGPAYVQQQQQAVSELRPRLNEALVALDRAKKLSASKNSEIAGLADVLLSTLREIDSNLDEWAAAQDVRPPMGTWSPEPYSVLSEDTVRAIQDEFAGLYGDKAAYEAAHELLLPPEYPSPEGAELAERIQDMPSRQYGNNAAAEVAERIQGMPSRQYGNKTAHEPIEHLGRIHARIEAAFSPADKEKDPNDEYKYQQPVFQCYGDYQKAWAKKERSLFDSVFSMIALGLCFANSSLSIFKLNINSK